MEQLHLIVLGAVVGILVPTPVAWAIVTICLLYAVWQVADVAVTLVRQDPNRK